MLINKGQLPNDSELMSDDFSCFFVRSPGAIEPNDFPLIPREEWEAEIKQMHIEEDEWWKGGVVDCLLTVELPFRLMLPDGELDVTYEGTTLKLSIRSDFTEIYHGPSFLESHANVAFVGPATALDSLNLKSLIPAHMPVFRGMKTTIVFNARALGHAFTGRCISSPLKPTDRSGIRTFNRSGQYFDSLAFGHIPFLNSLITAYRSVSGDPYAFEVTEWDVPVWYAEDGTNLVRIGLMPYWDCDQPFAVGSREGKSPFFATTIDDLKAQLADRIAAGKLDLLDALSLSYRGRYGDAVRAAVTAVEVVVEAKLRQLLADKGLADGAVEQRLDQTRSNFVERVREYERLSQRRIPGPLLSIVPYINGLRLRHELESVRKLRHKIVHEGVRITSARKFRTLSIITMHWRNDEFRIVVRFGVRRASIHGGSHGNQVARRPPAVRRGFGGASPAGPSRVGNGNVTGGHRGHAGRVPGNSFQVVFGIPAGRIGGPAA